ncbi:MAG: SCO family protein [Chromatiales bacterium]|nr:MAG: SCO family protein [Chromatiales bacterium]
MRKASRGPLGAAYPELRGTAVPELTLCRSDSPGYVTSATLRTAAPTSCTLMEGFRGNPDGRQAAVRFDSILLATVALLATTATWAATGRVLDAIPPKVIADFELTDQNDQPFKLSTLRGSPVLLFFGFTHCPDVCPSTLGQLQVIAGSPDKAVRETRMVMISVDGDRDKPADMKQYLLPVSPEFIGLTGNPRRVRDIAGQFSAVFFKSMSTDSSGRYLMDHTSQVYLLDRQGRLRSTFFNATVDDMTAATRRVALEKD